MYIEQTSKPKLVVLSTLFPHSGQPNAGVFIRERMFRVGKKLPITVVAPVPWFPFQGLVRLIRPHFRPDAPLYEQQKGVEIFYPRFLSVPGLFKSLDGFFMAIGCRHIMKKLKDQKRFNIIDAHFGYPDGYAATLLGKWLSVPVCITMRGTEVPHASLVSRRVRLIRALRNASRIFSVSESLRQHAISLGIDGDKITVVGNGVDTQRFYPVDKTEARKAFALPLDAKVMITVGGLVERKGFHRVIEIMPALMKKIPDLHYLIIGGASAEGDWTEKLKGMVQEAGLEQRVHFLGTMSSDKLKQPLSSADVFVLSTRNEGWANVILEAMACGVPVIASDVGGNAEVVANETVGTIVPFGDSDRLKTALEQALTREWNTKEIINYARDNSWDKRVAMLEQAFSKVLADSRKKGK